MRPVISLSIKKSCLFHQDDEVLAGGPECLGVGDTEHVLLIGIALQRVRAGGMTCQDLSRLAVKLYLLVDTDVDLGKVLLIEVRTEHLARAQDILFLQLLLGAEYEPT